MGNCASAAERDAAEAAELRAKKLLQHHGKGKRKSKTAVPLSSFSSYVSHLLSTREGDDELLRQIERLNFISANCERLLFTTESGQSVQNLLKNRYTNLLPYDNNRVVLTDGEAAATAADEATDEAVTIDPGRPTDYVNASFVACCGMDREFVACQAPLPDTVADHWRMVWQVKSHLIVMLTECVECQRQMCHRYWAESVGDTVDYGDFSVTTESETTTDSHVERQLLLRLRRRDSHDEDYIDDNSDECRQRRERRVLHLQCRLLPDAPTDSDDAGAFCQFVDSVASKVEDNDDNIGDRAPVVVHCDSGVGRTGVFLGVHRLAAAAADIAAAGQIDVPAAVAAIRLSRTGMVHSKHQLAFIYRAALWQLRQLNLLTDEENESEQLLPTRIAEKKMEEAEEEEEEAEKQASLTQPQLRRQLTRKLPPLAETP